MSEFEQCLIQVEVPNQYGTEIFSKMRVAEELWPHLYKASQPNLAVILAELGGQSPDKVRLAAGLLNQYKKLWLGEEITIERFGYSHPNPHDVLLHLRARPSNLVRQLVDNLGRDLSLGNATQQLSVDLPLTIARVTLDTKQQREEFPDSYLKISQHFAGYRESFLIEELIIAGSSGQAVTELVRVSDQGVVDLIDRKP